MLARISLAPAIAVGLLLVSASVTTARAEVGEVEPELQMADPSAKANPWLDGLSWQLLVSSFYMFNAHRVSGPYNSLEYPYADSMGFGVTFAGGDVSYRSTKWGLTLALRWGQNVDRLTEFEPVSLGYVTWIPCSKLTLDLGYFDAFIGIENENEWMNPNFTRGIIYFRVQPFRHLGFRAVIEPHDQVDITVIAASGSIFGTSFPSDLARRVIAPAVGAQVRYTPHATVDLRLGAVASPNGSDGNRNWEATIDFIVSWTSKAWMLFMDGEYQLSRNGTLTGLSVHEQWGVSTGGRYEISDQWSVGGRGEYFGASAGSESGTQFTLTATVRYSPVQYLIISLEPRAEFAANDLYFAHPFVADPGTGETTPSLNKDWFFGFWVGVTARIGS